jgi:hypothetical protein
MGGRHAAIITGGPSGGESMDVDPEDAAVHDGDPIYENEGALVGSGSKPSTPVVAADVGHGRSQSGQDRPIPRSMASILNSYPEEDAEMRDRELSPTPVGGSRARVARDSGGRPLLPLQIPPITLRHLGRISKQDGYHNSRTIYPIGYEVERRWMSSTDRDRDVEYTCRIIEGPPNSGPTFQVVAKDQPYRVISKGSANEAWEEFSREARAIRQQAPLPFERGDDYFGLTNGTIKALIQEMPGARDLERYKWVDE